MTVDFIFAVGKD